MLEAFQVDTQIPGIYREQELGFTEFRLTDALPIISASDNVIQEVVTLLRQHEEFMVIASLKMASKHSGKSTVFSLEDKNSGKAILAFWTDAARRKLGIKVLLTVGRERRVLFKHLKIDADQWYNIIVRVYKKTDSNDTISAAELFINCEFVGVLDMNSQFSANVRNRSLRLLLGQRGRGETSSWSKWNVSKF